LAFLQLLLKQEPSDEYEEPQEPTSYQDEIESPQDHNSNSLKRLSNGSPNRVIKIRRLSKDQQDTSTRMDTTRLSPNVFNLFSSAPPDFVPPENATATTNTGKRMAFLNGSLSAEEIIKASGVGVEYLPKPIREIRAKTEKIEQRLKSPPTAFHANISRDPRLAARNQQRSPLIAGNFNSTFVSQSSRDTIRETLAGQRYRNIPQQLQNFGRQTGVDLDSISQRMREATEDESETLLGNNSRTTHTQTDPVQAPAPKKPAMVNKEVQTTKNSGVYYICIDDLNKLTEPQRKAFLTFKRVSFSDLKLIFLFK
jgi:hypothetical protein